MRQSHHRLEVEAGGAGLHDVTREVRAWAESQGISDGLLTVFCRHTSCSLLIQENADPDVRRDLEDAFARLVPRGHGLYRHDLEGPDDMPAHVRAALTQVCLSIPMIGRRLQLGRWQGVYLFEHRDAVHRRELILHLVGD